MNRLFAIANRHLKPLLALNLLLLAGFIYAFQGRSPWLAKSLPIEPSPSASLDVSLEPTQSSAQPLNAQPLAPKLRLMVLAALLLASSSSVALVMLLERHNPLLSPADVCALDLGVRGTVPWLSKPEQQLPWQEPTELALQRLASGMTALRLRRRRILVSSAVSGEGKTTVVIGLGRALAALGFRVLLVDGDFSRAGLTQRLQREAGALSNMGDLLGVPRSVAPNLDLMPTAPVQPHRAMAFVARGQFDLALSLAEREGHYDYLLVDSAPVALTRETLIMGVVTENVLLVARAGVSHRQQVYRTLGQFSRYRINILGLLMNDPTQNSKPKASQGFRPKSRSEMEWPCW